MVSASVACSRTASLLAPAGGMSLIDRTFSDPVLMNCVGSWPTSVRDATYRTAATPTTASLVHLLRSAPVMSGVYARIQNEFLGSRSEERRVGKECRSRWWLYH